MSKGSGNRVRDTKRYEENYGKIDWSEKSVFELIADHWWKWGKGPYGVSVMEEDAERQRLSNLYLGAWLEARNNKIMDGDDDGNAADEAVGTH